MSGGRNLYKDSNRMHPTAKGIEGPVAYDKNLNSYRITNQAASLRASGVMPVKAPKTFCDPVSSTSISERTPAQIKFSVTLIGPVTQQNMRYPATARRFFVVGK